MQARGAALAHQVAAYQDGQEARKAVRSSVTQDWYVGLFEIQPKP